MTINQFIEWLYATPLSSFIRDTGGLIASVQSIHILGIAVVLGSALALELRVVGLLAPELAITDVAQRFLPWLWGALLILVITGLIMILGEPDRTLTNWVFWTKMGLVALAVGLVRFVRQPSLNRQVPPAKWQGYVLIVVWVAIIFCGRWIAYVGGA